MPIPSSEHYCCHGEHYSCLGDRNTLIRRHVDIFKFLIPVLLTLVVANVEGTNKPLLETHGINIWAFLVGLGAYSFANSSIIAVVFGSLSAVSLVSTIVPQLIGYIILCISWIWAAVYIVVVYEEGTLYKGTSSWIYNYIMEPVLTHIRSKWFHEAGIENIFSFPGIELPPPALADIV